MGVPGHGCARPQVCLTIRSMNQAILEVLNLTKRYGAATVVNDVSFAIAPGECLGVIGPNGAGKTTTIRMCLDRKSVV